MALLKLKNISDNTIIEIISFNIDINNNIVIIENGIVQIISLSTFKDMTLGTLGNTNQKAANPTHEIYND